MNPADWHIEINVWSLLAGIGAFLAAWAAKHFLDRLILPRVIDGISRTSKRRALARARKLRDRFNHDLAHIENFPALMVQMFSELYYMILLIGLIGALDILGMPAFVFLVGVVYLRTTKADRRLKILTTPR